MKTPKNIIVLTYSPKMASEKIALTMQYDKVAEKSVWLDDTTSTAQLNSFIERYSPNTEFNITRVDDRGLSKLIFQNNFHSRSVDNIPQVDLPHLSRLFASGHQYDSYVCPAYGVAGVLRTRKMLAQHKQTEEADQ